MLDLDIFEKKPKVGGKRRTTAEKKLAYKRKWYQENRKKSRDYNKKYYEEHKKEIKRRRSTKK